MKTSYCSLKDAFRAPDFSKQDEEIILQNKEVHNINYNIGEANPEVEPTIKENFHEDCQHIQNHLKICKNCSCNSSSMNSLDIAFNDILNMILIVLMIWIIIYKPSL